jgi:hypothetical protein
MAVQVDNDRRIAALASRQHGVVSRAQLKAAGLSRHAIDGRLGSGHLIALHRGVYAVGHRALTPHARWLAAVLACGPGAVLSHASAATLWELRGSGLRPHVTVPTTAGRRAPSGVRLHRYRSLGDEEVTTHRAIPVTTVERTLLDLAATLRRRALERAVDQAEVLRLLDHRRLLTLLDAHRGRPGSRALAELLDQHQLGSTLTRSDLEELFLEFCDRHGIPRPHVNQRVTDIQVDFHWPDHRLVVEVDGWAYHRTRAAFERDRARDARLAAVGYRTLRFTDRQLDQDPDTVVAALRGSLSTSPG